MKNGDKTKSVAFIILVSVCSGFHFLRFKSHGFIDFLHFKSYFKCRGLPFFALS